MITERYTVIFSGLNQAIYSDERLSEIWENEADEVYKKTGIYITARMNMSYFICGRIRNCNLGGESVNYVSVRNPSELSSKTEFYNVFLEVVQKLEQDLETLIWVFRLKKSIFIFLKVHELQEPLTRGSFSLPKKR